MSETCQTEFKHLHKALGKVSSAKTDLGRESRKSLKKYLHNFFKKFTAGNVIVTLILIY